MKYERLKNIISITKGKKHNITDTPSAETKRLIQIDDLRNDDNGKYTDDKKGVFVKEEDLLIVWDGANAGTIGYGKKGFIGSTIAALKKLDPVQYNTEFLGKFLQSKFSYLRSRATGATIPHINRKVLETLKIPIFEISDQIRIATLLFRAKKLIAKRKESIRLLDELLKSTFLEMFDSNTKSFKEWPVREIQQLAAKKKGSMRTGPFGSNLLHKEFTSEGDVAVLGIDNAVNNKFEWNEKRFISKEKYETLSNYRIFSRDVIITIMGTTGRSSVIPDDIPLTINTKHLAAITLNETETNPYFLSYSIHSSPFIRSQLRSKKRGAIMSGLNLGIIKKLKIKRPPIELQDHFEFILKRIEVLKIKYEASLRELENLYGSLSQRAFRGELNLSGIPVELSGKAEIDTKQKTTHPELEVKPKAKKKEVDKEQKQLAKKLKQIIKKRFQTTFTFNELWNNLIKEDNSKSDNLSLYEEVKSLIFKWLLGNQPFLMQLFDEDRKKIVLKVIE
jgi:type I restriction enzyme S subunit